MKRCPNCAEEIQGAALACRYCGANQPKQESSVIILVVMAAVLLGGMLFSAAIEAIKGVFGGTDAPVLAEKAQPAPSEMKTPAPRRTKSDNTPSPFAVETLALRKLKTTMRDPSSIETRGLRVPPGTGYLCGEVNGANAYGGKTGYKRFMAGGHSAMPTVVEDDGQMVSSEFENAWRRLC